MKVTANIATYPARAKSLKKMVLSIYDQFDIIRICLNGYDEIPDVGANIDKMDFIFPDKNHTDNGKFYALDCFQSNSTSHKTILGQLNINANPEYYFTLDDDLIYPPDYVETTIAQIKKYGCIISHHGRVLNGLGLDYYHAHQYHACTGTVDKSIMIDVCGTGVTAFDTRYFHPKGLANSEHKLMSDLIFSLEAAKQCKTIGLPTHKTGWIKGIQNNESIFDTEVNKGIPVQNKIADEIYNLRYGQ